LATLLVPVRDEPKPTARTSNGCGGLDLRQNGLTDGGERRLRRRPAVCAARFFPLQRCGEVLVLKKGQGRSYPARRGDAGHGSPAPL